MTPAEQAILDRLNRQGSLSVSNYEDWVVCVRLELRGVLNRVRETAPAVWELSEPRSKRAKKASETQ